MYQQNRWIKMYWGQDGMIQNNARWYDLNSIRYELPSYLMTFGHHCLWIVWRRHKVLQYGVNENKMTPTTMWICTALIIQQICTALNNHLQLNSPTFSLWIEIALTFACLECKILMCCKYWLNLLRSVKWEIRLVVTN